MKAKTASFIENVNDGLYYIVREDGSFFVADIVQGNILKIREQFSFIDSKTEFDLVYIPTTDGILTFKLCLKKVKHKKSLFDAEQFSGGGGGGGISGINVDKDGTLVVTKAKTLNFIGDLVTVTDAGAHQADITIEIPSMTTAERLAFTPVSAMIVEDTTLDMYFKWSTVTNSWNPF